MSAAVLRSQTHELVWVEGPDASRFLQGIISQDVEGLSAGELRRSFFLGPQGKLRALFWVGGSSDRILVVTDPGRSVALADDLAYYRIRVKAEIRVDERPRAEIWGDVADTVTGTSPGTWVDAEGSTRASIPLAGAGRVLVVGSFDTNGLEDLDPDEADRLRVVAGEPRFGSDVDDRTIPQETGLVPEAVSFTKGCYLGQELVARIDSRGHVNRTLRRLDIDAPQPPPDGARVVADGSEVGAVTSVRPNGDRFVALALLRREVEPGDEVQLVSPALTASAVVVAV